MVIEDQARHRSRSGSLDNLAHIQEARHRSASLENIANHHFVHIHCYMLLSLQVSNNWPTDYLPLKISSISDRSFFRYGFRGL